MPERNIDTGFWNDPFVQPKSFNAKGLYLYSWTNQHCNPAGFYEITMVTMTRETCLSETEINEALAELHPKVVWYPDKNLLWVRPFVKRQSRSPKFLIAAGKALESIPYRDLITAYLDYYRETYNIEIPYRYPIDTLSIPSARAADQKDSAAAAKAKAKANTIEEGEYEGEKPQDPKLAVIMTLYEQNVATLTPMVAEKLKDIRDYYPEGWFQAALQEAIDHNARSLAYITAILERWHRDGFKSEKKETVASGKKKKTEGLTIDE